jgi:hypothetical protein
MKKFLLILLSIIIASPISALLFFSSYLFLLEDPGFNEYAPFWGGVFAYSFFQIPFYVVIGIPVTLLIDFATIYRKHTSLKIIYLFQFVLYTISGLLIISLLSLENGFDVEAVLLIIPVLTYFHILFFLRKHIPTI